MRRQEELALALAQIKEAKDHRVQIVRVIVDEKGNEVGRLPGGSFISKTWGQEDTNGANEEPS
jgi:hypothetical protein